MVDCSTCGHEKPLMKQATRTIPMSESATVGPRFITPTYQSMIINALSNVVDKFNVGSVVGAWFALRTTYTILIPDIKKEVTS